MTNIVCRAFRFSNKYVTYLKLSNLVPRSYSVFHHILLNKNSNPNFTLKAYSDTKTDPIASALIDLISFDTVCSDTLEALCDYFEELTETSKHLAEADVTYGDGVLTVNFGKPYGTYVINRQTPNRQIWLSSPTSGPKRFDFITSQKNSKKGYWIYKHDGSLLHDILQKEIKIIVQKNVEFNELPYSTKE